MKGSDSNSSIAYVVRTTRSWSELRVLETIWDYSFWSYFQSRTQLLPFNCFPGLYSLFMLQKKIAIMSTVFLNSEPVIFRALWSILKCMCVCVFDRISVYFVSWFLKHFIFKQCNNFFVNSWNPFLIREIKIVHLR